MLFERQSLDAIFRDYYWHRVLNRICANTPCCLSDSFSLFRTIVIVFHSFVQLSYHYIKSKNCVVLQSVVLASLIYVL